MKNELKIVPSYWASVSGGKDSLYMLKIILQNPNKYPLDGVAHYELDIDYPFIKNVIDYMESECEKFNIPFVRIKPRTNFNDLFNKYGYPSRKSRWCNSKYKMDCHKQLQDFLKSQNKKVISYIGFCADEQRRFKDDDNIYPLVIENIYEYNVLQWARTVPIFNNFYLSQDRCGCMCCALQTKNSWAYLYKYYPEEFYKYMQMAKTTEDKFKYNPFASTPKYNADYLMDIIPRKYLPLLEQKERTNSLLLKGMQK